MSTAGDVNGDGYADILVGTNNYEGETYVVFGSGSGFAASLDLSTLDGSNGFRLDGIELTLPPPVVPVEMRGSPGSD